MQSVCKGSGAILKLKVIVVLVFLTSMISTSIYIDIGVPVSLTLFKLLSPFIFLLGLLRLNIKKIDKFNFNLFSAISLFLIFGAIGSNEYISLANIILLAFGALGIYFLYENIDRSRRQHIMLGLLLVLFVQSTIELAMLALGLDGDLFLFSSNGRIDGWVTESSHFVYIMMFLFVTYFVSFNIGVRQALLLLLVFLPSIYFSKSAYGYLFLLLSINIVLSHNSEKTNNNRSVSYLKFASIFIIFIVVFSFESDVSLRLIDTAVGIYSGDDQVMDSSARVRLLPFLTILNMADTFSIGHVIFLHGLGSSGYFIRGIGLNTDEGHLTSFLYDFGLVGILWLTVLIGYITRGMNNKFLIRFMFVIMMFNMNVGTQVFWFSIFCLAVIRLESRYSSRLLKTRPLAKITM